MKIAGKVILKKSGYIILLAIALLLCLRLFLFDVYRIPSDSMKNKFRPGDYIFINKAFNSVHLNDIFVFTIKKEMPGFFVKRCVGLPRSAIEIKNGIVNVDGKTVTEPPCVRRFYKIWFHNFHQLKEEIGRANIDKFENRYRKFPRYVFISLDNLQKDKLKKGIDSITRYYAHDPDSTEIKVAVLRENSLDIPLFTIPFKGMKFFFNQQTPLVYDNAIRYYEDSSFHRSDGYFYLKGKRIDSYIFKRNYFFMMGDNRDIAIDSRRYGLIPEENLIGKYMFRF